MMQNQFPKSVITNDSQRDALRFRTLVSELVNTAEQVREDTARLLTVDAALAHLLSRLCAALRGEKAFLAKVKPGSDEQGAMIELIAVYPEQNFQQQCLPWTPLFLKLRDQQRSIIVERFAEENQEIIPGLEVFGAKKAVVVRVEIAGQMRFIGVCDRHKSFPGPFLAADRMILEGLTDLFTFGIEIGERRRQELEQLQKTALSISAELTLDELLQEIAQRAGQVFQSPVGLMLWDDVYSQMVIKARSGLSDQYMEQVILRERLEAGLVEIGDAVSMIIPDLRNALYGNQQLIEQEGLVSVLSAQLKVGGNLLGILNIYSRSKERQFDQHDQELAEIFASQAAVAIRNASLRRRVADDGKKAAQLVQNVSSPEMLAQLLVKEVSEVLHASAAGLIFWEEEVQALKFDHSAGLSDDFKFTWSVKPEEVRQRFLSGDGNQPTMIADLAAEPFGPENLARAEQLISALVVPLVSESKIIGLLVVYSKGAARRFEPVELELIQIFINQAIQAFTTASAFQEVRSAHDAMKRMLDTIRAVAHASSLESGLDALSRYLVEWLKVSFCHIFIYEKEEHLLVKRAASPVKRGFPFEWDPDAQVEINLETSRGMLSLVNLKKPEVFHRDQVIEELDVLAHLEQVLGIQEKLVQVLVFPLFKDEQVLGICTLGETRSRPGSEFNDEKVNNAVSLASQAVPLILRLKMQQTREHRAFQEGQLRKSGERIAQNVALEPGKLTRLIAEEACKVLNADCAVVYPYFEDLGVYDVNAIGDYGLQHKKERYSAKLRGETGGTTSQILKCQPIMVVDDVRRGWSRDTSYQINLDKNKFLQREKIGAFVGLRMQIDNRPLGALFVNFRRPHHFYESELDVMEIFSNQAAVAINQARLLQRGAKDHAAIEAMSKITQMIGGKNRADSILRRALRCALNMNGRSRNGMVVQQNPEGTSFELIAQVGFPENQIDVQRRLFLFQAVLREKKVCLALDTLEDPVARECGYGEGSLQNIRSLVAVPFSANGQGTPDCIMLLESGTVACFTPDDREVLADLAGFVSIAWQGVDHYHQIHENIQLQANLLQASQDIAELVEPEVTLQNIVNNTKTALKCDVVTLHTYNKQTQQLNPGPFKAGILFFPERLLIQPGLNRSLAAKIIQSGQAHFSSNVEHDTRLLHSLFVKNEQIKSSAGIPLIFGGERLGLLYVNYRRRHPFSREAKRILSLFAGQAALALHNAQMYDRLRTKHHHMRKVHDASKLIIDRISAGREQLLRGVLKEAVDTVTGARGDKATIGTIQIYRENALIFESYYPLEQPAEVLARLKEPLPLDPAQTVDGKLGITVRAFLDKKPKLVPNTQTSQDYRVFCENTRSELAVPLIDNGQVIGVLNVESDQENNFDEEDLDGLVALADLAVIALKNSEQAEQLSRANSVAIMGAWGADVAHDINREVGNIRLSVKLLTMRPNLAPDLRRRIDEIDACAEAMRLPELVERPGSIPDQALDQNRKEPDEVDQIIAGAAATLRDRIKNIDLSFSGGCPGRRVVMDKHWITRILRHLVVNAARETLSKKKQAGRPQIKIITSWNGASVIVEVEDNGPGVPREYESRIFKQPLPSNGQGGRGLLLIQFFVEHHGGKIWLAWSKPGVGSRFAFTLLPWQRSL